MNLNSQLNSGSNFKKILGIALVVLVCLLIGIGLYIGTVGVDEPVSEAPDRTLVPDENPIPSDTPQEVLQSETIGQLYAVITNKRDLSTRIEYDIEIGVGENKTSSVVKATSSTVFFDFGSKRIINPGDVRIGDNVIVYATGKHNVGNLSAAVIGLGTDTTYSYGSVIAINAEGESSYIWTLRNTYDKLYVDSNTVITNGYTGASVTQSNILKVDEKLLFKGSVQVTDMGNIIYCTEIIVLGV